MAPPRKRVLVDRTLAAHAAEAAVESTPATGAAPPRQMFHSTGGGIDFSRLFEQLIPSLLIGCLVIYANFRVMQSQVDDLRKELDRAAAQDSQRQVQIQAQSEKLAGITAQITAFLGQQVTINTSMDARMTYLERLAPRRNE